jgi:putative membrane protein insertion efficiency factor
MSSTVNLSARVTVRRLARLPVLVAIRFYQSVISPWTAPSCRYYPSCSQYALVAIERHGVVRGGWLAVRRLGRCHPWAAGGVDHVPVRANAAPTPLQGA